MCNSFGSDVLKGQTTKGILNILNIGCHKIDEVENAYYIPRYELFVRTQNIFNGSTIASACIGVMSTSHHSSIVAQYHHSRTKLSILAMDLFASTATTDEYDVDNGFVAFFRIGSLFVVVESMKNN